MKLISLSIYLLLASLTYSQTYNNPGGTISTCSGTFYDTGGSGSSYGNNENITTTFCSDAGDCISLNFTTLRLRNADILTIYDGPNNTFPVLGSFTNTNTPPGSFTSTTGCLTFTFTSNGAQIRPGWVAAISCAACVTPADYIHSATNINNEYVGNCLVSDCGPFTYADDGDGGNYSLNINQIYRVFCPDAAGQCMEVTFNSFVTEATFDFLVVKNGPTQNSTDIISLDGDLSGSVPFTLTSTDASGCLTFRFNSDFSVTAAGWNATMQCVPCAGGPNGTDNNDCINLTPLCASTAIGSNSTGPGIVAEGCTGSDCPAGGENHTNWFSFQAFTSGTVDITMTPSTGTDDYDFAIYGPNVTCAALGSPIRCSDSGVQGVTGTNGAAGDNIEDVLGDSFLQTLNVIAGEVYILVVDEWSPASGGGYTLSFGGTASLDCTLLPVELSRFEVEYVPDLDVVDIVWTTKSELDNNYFEVERSSDGINFKPFNQVEAIGNSNTEVTYYTVDADPIIGVNYYRLKQVDIDGAYEYSEVRSVNILDDFYDIISVAPNPTNDITEVIFNSYSKELAVMQLFDSQGTLIESIRIDCTPGGNRINVDLSSKRNGLYMITISTNNNTYTAKIIKN